MSAKRKEDERKFILECIELYHNLPALWNVKSSDYNNRGKKNEQYEILLSKYRENYPEADKLQLVKKFNSLRTNFRKELKRIKDGEHVAEPTLWYFEEMQFLLNHQEEEPSTSQYNIKTEQDEYGEVEIDTNDVCDSATVNTLTVNHENGASAKKQKKWDEGEEFVSPAPCQHPEQNQGDFDKIAAAWAVELRKMEPEQQLFAKKAINDILFEGQMGTLHRNSVQINANSPYI